jgi:hypothetical protein
VTIERVPEALEITETPSMSNLLWLIFDLLHDPEIENYCDTNIEFGSKHEKG